MAGSVYHSLSEKINIEKNDEIWKIYEENGIIYFQSFTTIYCYHGDEVKARKGTIYFIIYVSDHKRIYSPGSWKWSILV